MWNNIEGFWEVHDHYICLSVVIERCSKIMDCLYELYFTGVGLSKTVLLWCQDIMCIKIVHDMGMNYMLE